VIQPTPECPSGSERHHSDCNGENEENWREKTTGKGQAFLTDPENLLLSDRGIRRL
jgi:hypothetical protein